MNKGVKIIGDVVSSSEQPKIINNEDVKHENPKEEKDSTVGQTVHPSETLRKPS